MARLRDAGQAEEELLAYAKSQGRRGLGLRWHECEALLFACEDESAALTLALGVNRDNLDEKRAALERQSPWVKAQRKR